MRIPTILTLIALTAASTIADPADLGPFEPDEHTLLLAHFDEGVDASTAVEDPRAEGRARLQEGLFGSAIHATTGWLTPETTVADIEHYPFFAPLTYSRGNLAANSGCLEMFVNFEDVIEPEYFRRVMTWEAACTTGPATSSSHCVRPRSARSNCSSRARTADRSRSPRPTPTSGTVSGTTSACSGMRRRTRW